MMNDHQFTQDQRRLHRSYRWLLWASLVILLTLVLTACNLPQQGAVSEEGKPSTNGVSTDAPADALATASPQSGTQNPPSPATPDSKLEEQADSVPLPTPDPWSGKSRVTILVMGLDYGDWESRDRFGPPRSDTMILLTVDPASRTAGMLSIPRDLWVTMPGIEGYHKINTAHRFGEYYKMPGGGPGLAMRTVERLLEVPINFYAIIDFYAFEDFIDELGGVELDVPEEIKVDPIGPGNTVVLQPGRQLLDGTTALAYARNRYTTGGDLDRARRQQQVILAIRDQVLNLETLPRLILRAPRLYRQLNEGINTNLTLQQAIKLAWLVREVDADDIKRGVIGSGAVITDRSEDGQFIFRPIPDRIRALRDEIFTGLTTEELIAAENARITIINESGDPQLGELTADYLKEMGLNVIESKQGEEPRDLTRLIDKADNRTTLRRLINLLHVQPSEIYMQYDLNAGTDMIIHLGADWAEDNPLGH